MLNCPTCHSPQLRVHDFAFHPWRVRLACRQCDQVFQAPSTLYNTHLPVLYALGAALPIRQIVELGPGIYSTPTFLNQAVFPDAQRVLSIEDSPGWARAIGAACPDTRLIVTTVPRGAGHLLPYVDDMHKADLLLIDDTGKHQRVETIKFVSGLHVSGVVIIHDFRHTEYMAVADFSYVQVTPFDTAVCWNGKTNPVIMDMLEQMRATIDG